MAKTKDVFSLKIPYWLNRLLGIDLYWRRDDLMVTLFFFHKVDANGYENDWFFRTWKHIRIWRGR